MPFEVFRRHQRKLLAVLAIMAMVAFTLDFSLFRNQAPDGSQGDEVVFTLYGKPVRRSDLMEMRFERARANLFMSRLGAGDSYFGGTTDEAIRDALILQHEADLLRMPKSPELAKLWLRDVTNDRLTPEFFDAIYQESFTQQGPFLVTDQQLLTDIANQVRLQKVLTLPGVPATSALDLDMSAATPLDLYETYRDQNERVSAYAIPFSVEDYVAKVGDPTEPELRAFYDKYKDQLPDPARETPGFKIPRRVQVEYVMVDQEGLVQKYEDELTPEQVRKHYEDHKAEFPAPKRELPANLFAGDKDNALTPDTTDTFLLVRDEVRQRLAEEKGRDDVQAIFEKVRGEVLDPFIDRYSEVEEQNLTAKEEGKKGQPLPSPVGEGGKTDLAKYAETQGLKHEVTELMTQDEAQQKVPLAGASIGSTWPSRGATFVEYAFEPRASVYETFEMADGRGQRFLGWKLADLQPESPALEKIRDQVVHAWKVDKARALAAADAKELAAKAREAKGDLKAVAGDRPLLTTSEVSKLASGFDPLGGPGLARPTDIPEIKNPSDALRDALFDLGPGEVKVESNAPKTVYYVLALARRTPADLKNLFGPIGLRPRLEFEVGADLSLGRLRRWMDYLRQRAGVTVESEETASAKDAPPSPSRG
jgi:peptidyl-prolyl cis-trans isomerase D